MYHAMWVHRIGKSDRITHKVAETAHPDSGMLLVQKPHHSGPVDARHLLLADEDPVMVGC